MRTSLDMYKQCSDAHRRVGGVCTCCVGCGRFFAVFSEIVFSFENVIKYFSILLIFGQ